MKRHAGFVLLIVLVVSVTFASTLTYQFVGDDNMLIERNSFYRSLDNLPRLFDRSYFTVSNDVFFGVDEDLGSGSVGYRPVLSATYFLDYALWGQEPFGYHLTNLVIHLVNACLVYVLLLHFFDRRAFACFAALVFAVHPITSEAVGNIGFRADLLGFMFAMAALIAAIRHRTATGGRRALFLCGAMVGYFLGVFSKEAAFILPGLILAYDICCSGGQEGGRELVRTRWPLYVGMTAIGIFFLIVYFGIFPNQTLGYVPLMGGSLTSHAVGIIRIFASYAAAVFLPWLLHPLPAVYAPPVQPVWSVFNLACVLFTVFYIWIVGYAWRRHRAACFFLVWFAVGYLPVSNLVPIVNTMAYRFMYLPAVGLTTLLAMGICRLITASRYLNQTPRLKTAVKAVVVLILMVLTFSVNIFWRDTFTKSAFMVLKFPEHPRGYHGVGAFLARRGHIPEAIYFYRQALLRDPDDPVYWRDLGAAYSRHPDASIGFLEKALALRPDYARARVDLCRAYGNKGDFDRAARCFEQEMARGIVSADIWVDYLKAMYWGGQRQKVSKQLKRAQALYPGHPVLAQMRRTLNKELPKQP